MNKMPIEIKNKLRKLQMLFERASNLEREVCEIIEDYGVDLGVLNGNCDPYLNRIYTEALAFITNAEGNIEDNIMEVEKVFLYYVNKK